MTEEWGAVHIDSAAHAYIERLYDVPGFFGPLDAALFARLFEAQDDAGVAGDVLEIGCWYGRAAILLEYLKHEQERLHVCDLFEDLPPTRSGQMELAASSERMPTRGEFEAWFRSFHPALPIIHQGPSSALRAVELGRSRFRFVHVDGSHTQEAVAQDIVLACELATEGGVVAFDDFANIGHPGVAAALWPAIMERELKPFACSPSKLYVTPTSDFAARYRAAIHELARRHGSRRKMSELPQSPILSIWPTAERRGFRARAGGRIRRDVLRTIVRRRTKRRRKPFVLDYIL